MAFGINFTNEISSSRFEQELLGLSWILGDPGRSPAPGTRFESPVSNEHHATVSLS